MAIVGWDIKLYLDQDGKLIITDKPREGMRELRHSRDVKINMPLEDAVTAEVELLIGGVDLEIPLEGARFIVADQEADAELVRQAKQLIEGRRRAARNAGLQSALDDFGKG